MSDETHALYEKVMVTGAELLPDDFVVNGSRGEIGDVVVDDDATRILFVDPYGNMEHFDVEAREFYMVFREVDPQAPAFRFIFVDEEAS